MVPSPALRRLAGLGKALRPLDADSPGSALVPRQAGASAAQQAGKRTWDMSEQETYMFDTMGFLRVRNMLSKEQVAEALAAARDGIDSGALEHTSMQPKGQHVGGDFYVNSFLYSKAIERVAYTPYVLTHPTRPVWPLRPALRDFLRLLQEAARLCLPRVEQPAAALRADPDVPGPRA
jgi:hypothetical protein